MSLPPPAPLSSLGRTRTQFRPRVIVPPAIAASVTPAETAPSLRVRAPASAAPLTEFACQIRPDELPAMLRATLRDEVHVRACLEAMKEEVQGTQDQIAVASTKINPMDRLLALAKRPRPAFLARASLQDYLDKLQQSKEACSKIQDELTRLADGLLEAHIRATNADYVRGLAAMENLEDWTRALGRFEEKLREFLRALGQARNMVGAGYRHAEKRLSASAQEMIDLALMAAGELEAEIKFINQLSVLHRQLVAATPCATVYIPEVPGAPYQDWVRALSALAIAPMQLEFDRIIDVLEVLERDGVGQLTDSVGDSRTNHLHLAHSYVLAELAALRRFADANWFNPDETAETMGRLEKRYFRTRAIHFDLVAT